MKMCMYVVFDRVGQISDRVWESRNDATALRAFQKEVIAKGDLPEEEMMLLCVGEIDHELNQVVPVYPAREVRPNVNMVDALVEEDEESV